MSSSDMSESEISSDYSSGSELYGNEEAEGIYYNETIK